MDFTEYVNINSNELMMLKRVVIILFAFVFITLMTIIIVKDNKSISDKTDVLLPDVTLNGINSSDVVLKKELELKKPIVLSFLSVECSHCKFQAMDIYNNSDLYKNVNHIVIVENHDSLNVFLEKTNLHKGDGYKLTYAGFETIDGFNIKGFPSTLIFAEGVLLEEISGEMKVEKLNLKIRECLNQDI